MGSQPYSAPTGGSVGISGQFLGIPTIYWIIGGVVYFGFIRKKK